MSEEHDTLAAQRPRKRRAGLILAVAVVAITPQVSRARLRVERCFPGHVYVVTAPIGVSSWPYQIAYEWAAPIKALVIQRSC